jgi:hypothetical protein
MVGKREDDDLDAKIQFDVPLMVVKKMRGEGHFVQVSKSSFVFSVSYLSPPSLCRRERQTSVYDFARNVERLRFGWTRLFSGKLYLGQPSDVL